MLNLFLIDQEKFIRDMFELVMKEKGHQIYTIESSEDCLYLIEDLSSNLVLIDLKTASHNLGPFVSGLREKGIAAKVVALSSAETDALYSDNQELFDGIISKPVSPSEVEGLLLDILGSQSAG